jgi:predicted transcriptional regulator/DNA-binding XRE family transcriptional regulator
MPKFRGKVVQAVRVQDSELGRVVGGSLRALRELAGLTQQELADRLHVGQAAVCKIEHRGDVQISSLQKYVRALGATLRVDAAFSTDALHDLNRSQAFSHDLTKDNQLVFPIFGDEHLQSRRDVVLSVRPSYSNKIIDGKKTIELRRRFPISVPRGTIAYIYSTTPERAIIGGAEIADIFKLPVTEIWTRFGKMAHIERSSFDEYYSGVKDGFALKFVNAREFSKPIELPELRERFGFQPPQSFLYANPSLCAVLQNEYSDVSD